MIFLALGSGRREEMYRRHKHCRDLAHCGRHHVCRGFRILQTEGTRRPRCVHTHYFSLYLLKGDYFLFKFRETQLFFFFVNRFSILALEWTLYRCIPSARPTPTSVQAEQGEQDPGSVTGNRFRLFPFSDKRQEYMRLSVLQLYSVGWLISAE